MAQYRYAAPADFDEDDLTIPLRVRRARAAERARAEAEAQRQSRRSRPARPATALASVTRLRPIGRPTGAPVQLGRHVPILGVVAVALAASLILAPRLTVTLDHPTASAAVASLDSSVLDRPAEVTAPPPAPPALRQPAAAPPVAAEVPRRSQPISYEVKAGDTLKSIATDYGLDVDTLVNTNHLNEDPDLISPGQHILVLPVVGALHKVQAGETLNRIAAAYAVEAKVIAALNSVPDADNLAVGQELVIPGAKKSLDLTLEHNDLSQPAGSVEDGVVKPLDPGLVTQAPDRPVVRSSRPTDADPLKFTWPLSGPITTQFRQADPAAYSAFGHTGIDIANDAGAPIHAAEWGKVVTAVKLPNSYGWYLVLEHRGGYQTLYGHMSKFLVGLGDEVEQGQVIGLEGSTGFSDGPHLHFEIRRAGGFLSPIPLLN